MAKNMKIETQRLVIRSYIESDLMECFHLMQDKELFTFLDMSVMSLDEYKNLFHWLISSYNIGFDGDFKYSFNVTLKETGEHIGWVGIGGVDFDHSIKEIYWLIGRNFQCKGYASEAAAAMLKYGFCVIGLDEIVAFCKSENIASMKIMQNIGLKYQGIVEGLPEEHDFFNGEPKYALSKNEFMCIV